METDQTPKNYASISTILEFFKRLPPKDSYEDQKKREASIEIAKKLPGARTPEEEELFFSVIRDFNFLEGVMQDQGKGDKILLRLSRVLDYEVIPAGVPVCHKDENGDKLYLILKGQAVAYTEILHECFNNSFGLLNRSQEEFENQETSILIKEDSKLIKQETEQLFQPKINQKELQKQARQSTRIFSKGFTREYPPIDIWDVDRTLSQFFNQKDKVKGRASFNKVEEDNVEMLFEFKLLEGIADTMPGKYMKDGRYLFKPIKKITEGECFGELALILNKPRSATVIASQDLHCLTLNKKAYQDVFMKRIDGINPNILFLQDFFPEATKINIARIAYLLKECHYSYNQIIYEEDEPPDAIYFIKEGEVQLMKKVKHRLSNASSTVKEFEGGRRKKLVVTAIGKGEVLGEEELLYERNREYTAVTNSEVLVLKLEKKTFDNLNETYKSLFNSIKKMSKLKKQFRAQQETHSEMIEKANEVKTPRKPPPIEEELQEPTRELFCRLAGVIKNIPKPKQVNNEHVDKQTATISSKSFMSPSRMQDFMPDRLTGGSKEFLRRVYDRSDRSKKGSPKSPRTPKSPNTRINASEHKSYPVRLDTTVTGPTQDNTTTSKMQDEYMFSEVQTPSKKFSAYLKKREDTEKLFWQKIQVQTTPKKYKLNFKPIQASNLDNSVDGSPEPKKVDVSSFSTGKKHSRPSTAAGYYHARKRGDKSEKSNSSGQKTPTNDIAIFGRLYGLKSAREKRLSFLYPESPNTSGNTPSTERSPAIKSSVSPREPRENSQESKTMNIHLGNVANVGTTFTEYFMGFKKTNQSEKTKRSLTPKKLMTGSAHNMFRLKPQKDHLKERYVGGSKVQKNVRELVLFSKLNQITQLKSGNRSDIARDNKVNIKGT